MRYRALLIDLDGVLRQWRIKNDTVETESGLPIGAIFNIAFSPEYLIPAITGRLTDAEWRARIAAHLELKHASGMAHTAVQRWSASPGELDRETLALVDRCHADVRVVLVTNATSRLPQDLSALGIAGRFHAIVNSSEIGVAKPAKEFYRVALERAGVAAEHALFVDDSQLNVQAAAALGLRGHHFIGHREMLTFLATTGVLSTEAP